jgi:uncharacterized protein (TIRG00374 family)
MNRPFPWSLRILLTVALIVAIAWHIRPMPVLQALAAANPWYVVAAGLLLFPNIGLQYAKWRMLLVGTAPGVCRGDVVASLFAGFSLGLVTPARLGEYGGRAAICRGAGKGLLVGLTAIDKASTLFVTVLTGLFAAVYFSTRSDVIPLFPVLVAGVAVLALVLGMLFVVSPWSPAPARRLLERRGGRVARRILALLDTVRRIPTATLGFVVLFSLLFYLTFVLQFTLLLAAFGPLHVVDAISGIATIMFIKSVIPPITVGELGVREGASVMILSVFGIAAASAFSASLLLFAINVLLPAVAGSWFLLRRRPVEAPRS